MIRRIFSVEIVPELREEFEDKFSTVALPDTLSSKGCLSVQILKPTVANPNVYIMISDWESIEALQNKFGNHWQAAFIPDFMRKFERSHSISHYESW